MWTAEDGQRGRVGPGQQDDEEPDLEKHPLPEEDAGQREDGEVEGDPRSHEEEEGPGTTGPPLLVDQLSVTVTVPSIHGCGMQ